VAETLTAADVNAEFDNVLDNLTPAGMDDYSANVAQMQTQTDPGEVATESLAVSTAEELARIRYILSEVTGNTYWYESPSSSIAELNTNAGITGNRIISGLSRSGSDQLVALDPANSSAEVVLRAAGTSFIYRISDVEYTISSDQTLSSLIAAPSANNTALVDDGTLAGADATKYVGEFGTTLTIGTVGSEISSLVGQFAAFKIVGAGTEYFTAFVKSATELTEVRRGYFFDTSQAPISRTTISDGDTITLMNLTWIYANTAGTIVTSYINPIIDSDQPAATLGQYWFDLATDTWKVGNGGSFDDANALPIGLCIQDSSNTVGARSYNAFKSHKADQTVQLSNVTNTTVRSDVMDNRIAIYGNLVNYGYQHITWDMTTDLDSGVSEGSNTDYYMYLDGDGDTIISDVRPYDRQQDYLGYYHPYHTWRCVGLVNNDGSSNLDSATLVNYAQLNGKFLEDISVETEKIKDAAVTSAKLADGSVTAVKVASGVLTVQQVASYTSNDTTTVPTASPGVIYALIVSGGGGGGAGGGTGAGGGGAGGGGGGAGGTVVFEPLIVTSGETVTITVGAAGSGGAGVSAGTGNAGTIGGSSTVAVSSMTLVALGARPGAGGFANSSGTGGALGAGGAGYDIGGMITADGGDGGKGADSGVGNSGNGATAERSVRAAAAIGGTTAGSAATGGGGGGGGSAYAIGGAGGAGGNSSPGTGVAAAANSGAGGGGGGGAGSGTGTGGSGGNGGTGRVYLFMVSPTDFT
jgi:hypothetical protein